MKKNRNDFGASRRGDAISIQLLLKQSIQKQGTVNGARTFVCLWDGLAPLKLPSLP
jgi:hypothetical protein